MNDEQNSGGAGKGRAGSSGHDINNLLSAMVVNLDYGLKVLREAAEPGGPLDEERLDVAIRGIENARNGALEVGEIVRDVEFYWAGDSEDGDPADGGGESTPTAKTSGQPEENGIMKKLDILLIDDEFRMGRVFERLLSDRAELSMVTTIDEAEKIMERQEFDVIFCDIHLPRVSGIDFYEDLKTRSPEKAARMIFITGGLYSEESQRFADEIKNPVVFKPFRSSDVDQALAEVLDV